MLFQSRRDTNSLVCLFPGLTYIFPVITHLLDLLLPEYYVLVRRPRFSNQIAIS